MSLGFSPKIGVHCGHKSRFLKKSTNIQISDLTFLCTQEDKYTSNENFPFIAMQLKLGFLACDFVTGILVFTSLKFIHF